MSSGWLGIVDFHSLPSAVVAVFPIAAAFVWAVGTRLASSADTVASRTGLSHASFLTPPPVLLFQGVMLLLLLASDSNALR